MRYLRTDYECLCSLLSITWPLHFSGAGTMYDVLGTRSGRSSCRVEIFTMKWRAGWTGRIRPSQHLSHCNVNMTAPARCHCRRLPCRLALQRARTRQTTDSDAWLGWLARHPLYHPSTLAAVDIASMVASARHVDNAPLILRAGCLDGTEKWMRQQQPFLRPRRIASRWMSSNHVGTPRPWTL